MCCFVATPSFSVGFARRSNVAYSKWQDKDVQYRSTTSAILKPNAALLAPILKNVIQSIVRVIYCSGKHNRRCHHASSKAFRSFRRILRQLPTCLELERHLSAQLRLHRQCNATQRNATQRNATQRNATQRNATQRNATQRNATQRNATQRNATQRNATQRNATQRNSLQCNDIEYPFQSTYRETAIACIQDGVLQSLDARKHVVLILLDLSAAFDTIDDDIRLTGLD